MKTIPVSLLVAGLLLPAVCHAEPPVPEDGKGKRRGQFQEAWKAADTNQDNFISQEEFAAMPRTKQLPEEKRTNIFKRLDKDTDGKLSRDELGRFGKQRDGEPMRRFFWELDADKNGGITLEEFKAGELFKKLPAEKQEAVFRRLDTDQDNAITPKDKPEPPFRHAHKRPDGSAPEVPDQVNRKLDADGDGSLSFAEFRVGPAVKNLTEDEQEDRFEALDRNKDLKISPEDFPKRPEGE